jgi:hypothetical protein
MTKGDMAVWDLSGIFMLFLFGRWGTGRFPSLVVGFENHSGRILNFRLPLLQSF